MPITRRDLLGAAAAAGTVTGLAAEAAAGPLEKSRSEAQSIVVNGLDGSALTTEYVNWSRAAGVDCWQTGRLGIRTFADTYNFCDLHPSLLRIVRSVAEIRQAKRDNRLALLLGWQSANPISNARDGENDWWGDPPRTSLRAYYEMGLRISGIAYQIANAFGGGAIDGQVGLTRAGRRLVEEIHKLRIVLDIGGHTGDQASRDALAMSAGVPVICSHAGTRHLADNSRNLSDELIDAIARTGGVIGVVAINDFLLRGKSLADVDLTPQGTVENMLDHVEYIRRRVGVEHVGLGPDFTHGRSPDRDRAVFGPDVMDTGPRRFVTGFENISGLPNVVAGLERRGWKPKEVQAFLGDNWIRVYQQVWGS